jgi:hypothetical protein
LPALESDNEGNLEIDERAGAAENNKQAVEEVEEEIENARGENKNEGQDSEAKHASGAARDGELSPLAASSSSSSLSSSSLSSSSSSDTSSSVRRPPSSNLVIESVGSLRCTLRRLQSKGKR